MEDITITLPKEIWIKIANACIDIADFDVINDEIKDVLRKTYYQIKQDIGE